MAAAAEETQITCKFVTRLPDKYRISPTPFAVPGKLTRYGLSEVINHLLDLGAHAVRRSHEAGSTGTVAHKPHPFMPVPFFKEQMVSIFSTATPHASACAYCCKDQPLDL